jgi:Tfp pilus assembly protein PilF
MPRSQPRVLPLLVLLAPLCCPPAWGGDPTALIQEGESKLQSGEIDAGLALLRQAVEADPGSSLAHTRLGGALLLKQEHPAAIAEFRTAIGLDPNNAPAFLGMAMAYLHGGDYALARAALDEAKRIDPTKGPKIDEILAYIDKRDPSGQAH